MNDGQAVAPVHTPRRKKISIMQINTDRKAVTTDIVLGRARRDGTDIILMTEPNKKMAKRNGWH